MKPSPSGPERSFQFYPLILLILLPFFLQSVSSSPTKIPRLSPFRKEELISRKVDESPRSSAHSRDFKKYYYTQTLDHFNYAPQSYANFTQKYVVNSKYWGGPNSSSPIFAYLGAEQPLNADVISYIGIINDNAPQFKALSVFIEVFSPRPIIIISILSICVRKYKVLK